MILNLQVIWIWRKKGGGREKTKGMKDNAVNHSKKEKKKGDKT